MSYARRSSMNAMKARSMHAYALLVIRTNSILGHTRSCEMGMLNHLEFWPAQKIQASALVHDGEGLQHAS